MGGWRIPPPRQPHKSEADFRRERELKVEELEARGLLRSERIRHALLRVRREDFVPAEYRDYAYQEVPLPLPGATATISCPHSYPLFYEPLGLSKGHRFLEIGLGSGYGTALAREIVGDAGHIAAVEIDPETLRFAQTNLERAGYTDVVLVAGDGGLGCWQHAPYDRICATAACTRVPPPLLNQLASAGRLILPLMDGDVQILTVVDKRHTRFRFRPICEVLYSELGGIHGVDAPPLQRLLVTCPDLHSFRRAQAALERALPNALATGAGYQGLILVESAENAERMAEIVTRRCGAAVRRVTAVSAEVPSDPPSLRGAAVDLAVEAIGPGESFAFRIRKRRPHGYPGGSHEIEHDVGGAIEAALRRVERRAPRVQLRDPDVIINAEVLGRTTLVGVIRRKWRADTAVPS
jgi:protein-L-isoaspartate(D-aspartate) O-methyltransferase